PMRPWREQQERIRRILDPPAMRMLREQQRKINEIMEPATMRHMRELQERMQDIIDPPALRQIREQQARFQKLLESPAFASAAWANQPWTELVPEETVEEVEQYEADLVDRVTEAEAAGSEDGPDSLGHSSFRLLLWQMEILLQAMEALTAALVAQGEL